MTLPSARSEQAGPAIRDPALWGALAAGLLLRAGALVLYPHTRAFADERLHYATGVLVSHFGLRGFGHWPPGYEALLGATFAVAGPDPLALKVVQVGLSLLVVALVYAIAREAGGVRAGRIAAWITAAYPTFVVYPHYLYSENLYLPLLTAAVWAIARAPQPAGGRGRLLAGGLFGLAVLTRSTPLYFLPLWSAWEWLRGRRERARQVAGVLVVALLVIAPWTLRNALHYRAFLLTGATLGPTAYFAFSEVPMNQDLGFAWQRPRRSRPPCRDVPLAGLDPLPLVDELMELFPAGPESAIPDAGNRRLAVFSARQDASVDHPARQRCELANAWTFAREHPGVVARQMLARLSDFWGPNSFLLRASATGTYPDGPLAASHYVAVKWVFLLCYLPLVAAAILAFGRRELPGVARGSGLFLLYYTLIHMLALASSRYRLPVMPLVIVLASLWLSQPRLPEGRSRRVGVALALAGFGALAANYLVSYLP